MKRTLISIAVALCFALPMMAQSSSEVGVIVGGSRRFVEGGPERLAGDFIESNFGLSNNAIDLYWSMAIEPDLNFKIRGGRIQTQIATPYEADVINANGTTTTKTFRRDFEGEVQHIEGVVEYRFHEAFGSSGLFGGVGYYRQSPDEGDSTSNYGFVGGVNADFPLSRRYGILVEGAYHWTNTEFDSRYMTLGAGLRVRF
jgi:predicted porin